MDRFLLAENPVNRGAIYILHTIRPRCLIRLLQPDEEWPEVDGVNFTHHVNKSGIIIPEPWKFYIVDQYDLVEDPLHLMNRAWRWWQAYLKWEDKKIDNEEI